MPGALRVVEPSSPFVTSESEGPRRRRGVRGAALVLALASALALDQAWSRSWHAAHRAGEHASGRAEATALQGWPAAAFRDGEGCTLSGEPVECR